MKAPPLPFLRNQTRVYDGSRESEARVVVRCELQVGGGDGSFLGFASGGFADGRQVTPARPFR